MSCGSSHTVALLDCDCVVSFGKGEDGQLGHGDAESCSVPQAVEALRGQGITAVSCGAEYSIAVSRSTKQLYSWGWGDFGRLGHGHGGDCFSPQPVAALSGVAVRQVACGDAHTLVVTDDGGLFTFGRNQNGQLGIGTTEDALAPRKVEALAHLTVSSVAAGAEHSVVATADGRVYAFGWGRYGCLGDGTREDRHVPTPTKGLEGVHVAQVACGWRHSICVSDRHKLYTFGWGKFGQIGHGDNEDRLEGAEVKAMAPHDIKLVAGGWRHTAAVDSDGQCYTWGWGKFGQLGLGDGNDRWAPEAVSALRGLSVELLACGWRHTVVTTADGGVWSWGRGTHYQLGHGDDRDEMLPRRLDPDSLRRAAVEAAMAPGGPSGVAAADRFAVVPEDAGTVPGGLEGNGGAGAFVGGSPALKKQRLDENDAAVPDS